MLAAGSWRTASQHAYVTPVLRVFFSRQVAPCSRILAPLFAVLQYGHGLLGDRGEATSYLLTRLAHNNNWVIAATDWYGMSQYDLLNVFKVLISSPSTFASIPESTGQGYVNQVKCKRLSPLHCIEACVRSQAALLTLAKGTFSTSCAAMRNTFTQQPVIGAGTKVAYYGISQGAVIGGGYVGSSLVLDRAVLGVPGPGVDACKHAFSVACVLVTTLAHVLQARRSRCCLAVP